MYRILLVDDEPALKISIQTTVDWEQYGFCLSGTASDGYQALDFIRNNPVDAVITDLEMPSMNGVSLIRELKKQNFPGPILVLSNFSYYDYVRDALTAGAYDYILKTNVYTAEMEKALRKMKEILSKNTPSSVSLADGKENVSAFPEEIFPATVCAVLFPENFLSERSGLPENLTKEVFEDISPVIVQTIHHNELLCVISEKSLELKKKDVSVKLKRLIKQFQVFTGFSPAVIYISGAENDRDIHDYYSLCTRESEENHIENGIPWELFPVANQEGVSKAEIRAAINYVGEYYMSKISLDDVAKYVNLNREYLSRVFHAETGMSLFSYINEVRMKKAAKLLTTNQNATIKEVATLVGFDNQYFFSKKFKDYYGVSPTEYTSKL